MLDLEPIGPGRFRAVNGVRLPNIDIVFGGQLLAQLATAASLALDGRRLTSLHAVFCRSGRLDEELLFDTEVLSAGRNAGSVRVRCHQGETTCVEAVALALAPQDLPITHRASMPEGADHPDDAAPMASGLDVVEMRRAGAVDVDDPENTSPPHSFIWARPSQAAAVPTASAAQALLAFATEPIFAAIGLFPHPGWGISQAYHSFLPAVVSHSMSFHEDPTTDGWWLVAAASPHLAGGRIFGRADVFTEDGRLVASVTQENLMRPVPPAG